MRHHFFLSAYRTNKDSFKGERCTAKGLPSGIRDLVLAPARRPAVLESFDALLGLGVTQPVLKGLGQVFTVDPKVAIGAGVGAEFVRLAVTAAGGTRRPALVGATQRYEVVPSDGRKLWRLGDTRKQVDN